MVKNSRYKKDFSRKNEYKEPKKRILVVCEDSKTTPKYLEEFCKDKKIRTLVDIKIRGANEPQPSAVLKYIEMLIDKEKLNPYDKIYCVFDKDQHKCYDKTLKDIKNHTVKIDAINSVPCFEFWVLLHFEKTDRHFANHDEIAKELKNKKHLKDYSKEAYKDKLYEILKDKTQTAINNAKTIKTENPSTKIHLLIEELQKL